MNSNKISNHIDLGFWISTGLVILYVFPIILANVPYIDDYYRILH
jgi:hypothetical protein